MGLIYIRCWLGGWYHLHVQVRHNASLVLHSDDNTKDGASKNIVFEAVILEERCFFWRKLLSYITKCLKMVSADPHSSSVKFSFGFLL